MADVLMSTMLAPTLILIPRRKMLCRVGISAPFTGPAKELGQNMKVGIEAAFNVANAKGGVYGRQLRLIAADDGYEPTRTAATMKQLYESDQVFGGRQCGDAHGGGCIALCAGSQDACFSGRSPST
jgi:hypothetical protein